MTKDTKGNVAVLVKSIIEKDLGMIRVKDSALVPYYVNKSKYMFEIEPEDKADLEIFTINTGKLTEDFESLKEEQLAFAKEKGANYIFVSSLYLPSALLASIVSPFMVISEDESDFLIRNYYKDVPKGVSKAAYDLKVTLFDKEYARYLKIDAARSIYGLSSGFFNFIFTLPYEDQNIETNKRILQSNHNINYTSILTREYSQGKHFQDYFDSIPKFIITNMKERVVSEINILERNPNHDVFLLKKGFVVSELDPMAVYRADAGSFINYFEGLGPEAQKFVIEKIYSESVVNQKVVDWLNEKYAPLLREVGFSGGN